MEYNFSYKITFGNDRNITDLLGFFADKWDKCRKVTFTKKDSWVDCFRMGQAFIKNYMELVAPSIQPLFVEKAHTMDVGDGLLFNGIMDLVTVDHIVVDYKTSAKLWPKQRAEEETQLTAYTMLYYDLAKVWPIDTHIHCFAKDTGKITVLEGGTRQQYQVADYIAGLHSIAKDITAGIFPKNSFGNWKCQLGVCPFYEECMG